MTQKPGRRIIVNVENLVLKGFHPEDRHAIAQGLQDQLTQLLSEPHMAQRLANHGSIPHLRVPPVTTGSNAKPQQIGRAAADGIGKGLKG
jgi:hypothetical protein